jgi:hypothetical protein
MTRSTFGQREAKRLAHTQATALKAHAEYVQGGAPRHKHDKRRDGSLIDRMLAWLSYFTLVFAAVITLTPDSAAAAALTIHSIVATALPG